jgi:hypothetical protein
MCSLGCNFFLIKFVLFSVFFNIGFFKLDLRFVLHGSLFLKLFLKTCHKAHFVGDEAPCLIYPSFSSSGFISHLHVVECALTLLCNCGEFVVN